MSQVSRMGKISIRFTSVSYCEILCIACIKAAWLVCPSAITAVVSALNASTSALAAYAQKLNRGDIGGSIRESSPVFAVGQQRL